MMTPEEFDRMHERAHRPWQLGPAAAPEVPVYPPVIVAGDDDRQTAGTLLASWLLGQYVDGPLGDRVRIALRNGKVTARLDATTGLLAISADDLGVLGRVGRDMFSAKLSHDAMKVLGQPAEERRSILGRLGIGGAS